MAPPGCASPVNSTPLPPSPNLLSNLEVPETLTRNLTLKVTYTNHHPHPCAIQLKVPILKDWPGRQTVHNFTITPKPDTYENDPYGNIYAVYESLEVPIKGSLTVSQKAKLVSHALIFNFTQSNFNDPPMQTPLRTGLIDAFPGLINKTASPGASGENYREHELSTPLHITPDSHTPADQPSWEELLSTDNSIPKSELARLAQKAAGNSPNKYYQLLSVYDFMRREFEYDLKEHPHDIKGMLKTRILQCYDAALLTSQLLHELGFTVRIVGGIMPDPVPQLGNSTHAWCEVFCPGLGFMPVDPAQGHHSYTRQMYFGKLDPNLVILRLGPAQKGIQLQETALITPHYVNENAAKIKATTKGENATRGEGKAKSESNDKKKRQGALDGSALPQSIEVQAEQVIISYHACPPASPTDTFQPSLGQLWRGMITATSPAQSSSVQNTWPEIKKHIKENPDEQSQVTLWLDRDWNRNELQDLNQMAQPAAILLKSWLSILSGHWTHAQELLESLAPNQAVSEAKACLYIFTMQSPLAEGELRSLKGAPISPYLAEATWQFLKDQRNWKELAEVTETLSRAFPQDYLIKIENLRGTFLAERQWAWQKAWNTLVQANPQDGYPYVIMGQLYMAKGRYEESLKMFEAALERNLQPSEKNFCLEQTQQLKKYCTKLAEQQ